MPSVLVTGAGRGIGRAVAEHLLTAGWTVHAGVRRAEDAPAGTNAVRLDVTDPAQVDALPETVGGRLDALVNNAGIVVAGPVEALSSERLREQLEVNLIGTAAVTRAVTPALRASRGRIVFLSSIGGRVSTPFLGAYSASKYAVEGLADALRVELRGQGVRVVLIEPGAIDTDMWRRSGDTVDEVADGLSPEHRALYGKQVAGMRKLTARMAKAAVPADIVAATIERALTADRPRARYVVGTDAKVNLALATVLPRPAFDALQARLTGGR